MYVCTMYKSGYDSFENVLFRIELFIIHATFHIMDLWRIGQVSYSRYWSIGGIYDFRGFPHINHKNQGMLISQCHDN